MAVQLAKQHRTKMHTIYEVMNYLPNHCLRRQVVSIESWDALESFIIIIQRLIRDTALSAQFMCIPGSLHNRMYIQGVSLHIHELLMAAQRPGLYNMVSRRY